MGAIKIKKVKEATKNNEEKNVAAAKGKRKWTDPAVVREDTERTTAYSRRYVMNNGTVKTVYSAEPVNYYDEAEKRWKEIDGALTEKDNCYENACGNVKAEIFKLGRGKGAKVSKGDASISWEFVGTKAESTKAKGDLSHKQTTLSVENCDDEKTGRKKSRAVYANVSANTDIEYVLSKNNLKENIIVKERSKSYEYVFKLKTVGVKPELALDEKSIELKDEQGVQFSIPAPFMADANGAESKDVYYELEQVDEETYNFTIKAAEAWINAEERAFPVTIDPQIIIKDNSNTELYLIKNYSRYKSYDLSEFGDWQREPYPVSGQIGLLTGGTYAEWKIEISFVENLFDLSSDRLQSAKMIFTPANEFQGTILVNGVETAYNSASGNFELDLIALLKNSEEKKITLLEGVRNSEDNPSFYSSATEPSVEIIALREENVRPTKKSVQLAGGVTADVNLALADYTLVYNDVSAQNSVKGMAINHVYKKSEDDYLLGKNLRLNLHETLVKSTDGDYVYTNAVGERFLLKDHYYYLNSSNKKVYLTCAKQEITVDAEGRLFAPDGKEVFAEYETVDGLKAVTRLDGFNDYEYLEQRIDDEKQLEEQIDAYETSLNEYVLVNPSKEIFYYLSDCILSHELFEDFKLNSERANFFVMTKTDFANEKTVTIEMHNKNLKLITKYYKDCVNLRQKLADLKRQLPVNYLVGENYIKGYNDNGQLVLIQDFYGGYVAIEYKSYYDGTTTQNYRIARIYDENEKVVYFSYNSANKLAEIVDVNGNKVTYTYSSSGNLKGIQYDNGENITFIYNAEGDVYSIDSAKAGLETIIVDEWAPDANTRTLTFFNRSTVKEISKAGVIEYESTETPAEIDKTVLSFYVMSNFHVQNVSIENDNMKEEYIFSLGELAEYYIFENNLAVSGKKIEYVPYSQEKITYSDKSKGNLSANVTTLFSNNCEVETSTLNQFNKPVSKTTSNVRVNASGTNTATITTEYTYDNDQKLIAEKTTTVYTTPATTVVAHKKYNYNAMGSLIRTESYVEGEELTRGKNIEETVYDDKGRVTKSFTYNTLDTSSKFYTETAYSDDGKAISKADPTGEHKTEYDYVDGTDLIRTEKLANGSKLAYGHDFDGTVTAITQSTEDGVENSTQKLLRYGEVVELKSGNTKINYTYDDHRRVTKIGLNGNAEHITYTYTDDTSITDISGNNIAVDKVVKENLMGEVFTTFKDKNGRVRQEKSGSTMLVQVDYEKDKITKIKDNVLGSSEVMEYDEVGNKTQYTCGDYFENYEYNNFGKISVKRQSNGVRYEYNYSNNGAGELSGMSDSAFGGMSFKRDSLGRLTRKHQEFGLNRFYTKDYGYYKVGDHATNLINTITYYRNYALDSKLIYTYDGMGNIVSVNEDGKQVKKYEYDKLCRLIKETDIDKNKEISYTYDNNGNILTKTENGVVIKYGYLYNSDQLVSFGNESIDYNVYGNPTTYRDMVAEWERCGLLKSLSDGSATVSFSYDGKGLRRTKKVGDVTTTYMYVDGKIISETDGTNYIIYYYDAEGILGINLNGRLYMFRKNVFGDVTHIFSEGGELVGKYSYTAYGECTIELDVNGIATLNPIRYRSYYYDEETGLYYLKSRYYDPEVGRFISIDRIDYVDPDTVNGLNLYAYCGNNPIKYVDPNGKFAISLAILGLIVGALLGATAGGIVAHNVAQSKGATGWELVGWTLLGVLGGAVVGGVIGAGVGTIVPSAGTFLGSTITFGSYITAVGSAAAITATGSQVLGTAAVLAAGLSIVFARTSKSNGFYGEGWPGDPHKPEHIHLRGNGIDIRIGKDGLPLPGEEPLSAQARKALKKLWSQFLKLFSKM